MSATIVLAVHDGTGEYWPYLAIAINSLLISSIKVEEICVLHDETLRQEAISTVKSICEKQNTRLKFTKIKLPEFFLNVNFGVLSPASIYRLAIPKIFKNTEKVVYIDADLIFHGVDITELIEAAQESPFSAVLDSYIGKAQKHREQLDRLELDINKYFNSGVLVMRPNLLPDDLVEDFINFCKLNTELSHPDQDFLNTKFKNNWNSLEARFNYQACVFNGSLFNKQIDYKNKIIHYAGKLKPLQGMMAPGFLPFWLYAKEIPKALDVFDSKPLAILDLDPKKSDVVLVRKIENNKI